MFFTNLLLIGTIGPALCILGASYAECNRLMAVSYFTIAIALSGGYVTGIKANNLDLAPNYAGVMVALATSICGVSGFIAPYVVGILTQNVRLYDYSFSNIFPI